MDKQKYIEIIADDLSKFEKTLFRAGTLAVAEELYNKGYRKIDEEQIRKDTAKNILESIDIYIEKSYHLGEYAQKYVLDYLKLLLARYVVSDE